MDFFRGGEAVLEQFGILFPDAPISIMVYNPGNLSDHLRKHTFHPSFLQRSGWMRRHFRALLPFFPEIVRGMQVAPETRVVLSSDAGMIKGISIPPYAIHVCYCHSPPRYIWGLEAAYFQSSSGLSRLTRSLFGLLIPRLQAFDCAAAQRVHRFIANSSCVQERIRRCYNRESVVIHPPVNIASFDHTRKRDDFFLIVSALVPYKRVDLAIDACVKLGFRLIVIGAGPEKKHLAKRASSQVTFMDWQPNSVVKDHMERCRALLFPGIEDFGITPCEAQAAGAPVIAFRAGGALETIRDGVTGLFFPAQTVEALIDCLGRFVALPPFSSVRCRENVIHLDPESFRRKIREFLERELPEVSWSTTAESAGTNAAITLPAESKFEGPRAFSAPDIPGATRFSAKILFKTPPLRKWSIPLSRVIPVASILGAMSTLSLGIYLTLRSSSDFSTLMWFPQSLASWSDDHGRVRNFPAYAALAFLFLTPCPHRVARRNVIALLAILAAGLELGQLFIATRWFDWVDIAWSWAGLGLAWAVFEGTILFFNQPKQHVNS